MGISDLREQRELLSCASSPPLPLLLYLSPLASFAAEGVSTPGPNNSSGGNIRSIQLECFTALCS